VVWKIAVSSVVLDGRGVVESMKLCRYSLPTEPLIENEKEKSPCVP
jgi:hypothetical protein